MIIIAPRASFTRPANTTAYTAGDLMANSATAGSVVPLKFSLNGVGRSGMVRRARLHKTTNTTANFDVTLHLFDAEPTVSNGDNGALAVATNLDSWLGTLTLDATTAGNVEAGASANATVISGAAAIGISKPVGGGVIYGLIEHTAGYAPGNAEVFTVWLEIEG